MLGFPSLFHDVPLDYLRRGSVSDRADIESVPPKLTAPQHLFYFWKPFEQLAGGNAFDDCDNFRGRKSGWRRYEQMDMIAVRTELNELKSVSLTDTP